MKMSFVRKQIGIIPGGFKPYTSGHHSLVTKAANENDEVMLLIGKGDRVRPGQLPVYWEDMEFIWNKYIKKILPGNVTVEFVGSPIGSTFKILEEAETSGDNVSTWRIYGDPTDLSKNFSDTKMSKYAPTISGNDQIILVPVDRESNVNISGTQMRSFVEKGDTDSFIANVPSELGADALNIFKLLQKRIT